MFVSHVSEDVSGGRLGRGRARGVGDRNALEYSTASELFELMARNQNFHHNEGAPLSATRDLVFLYKNLDAGTKLLSDPKEFKRKSPNQRVESIVYEDFDSDSDLSEICSEEDICNMILINKERIDRFNSCLDNTLCPKFGNLEINTRMTLELENNFSEQNVMSNFVSPCSNIYDNALAVSMTDYIQSNGMQSNHNLSMDNIIRYVNYTIDQLKRISNGDYLTDKAREKWKEIDRKTLNMERRDSNKALVKATGRPNSPPQPTRATNKFNAIIRSEVNIRTLSRLLEKKLVVEVSKPLRESLKYLNVYRPKSLLITCKPKKGKESEKEEKPKERINVKLESDQPVTAYVVNRIAAISITQQPDVVNNYLPLPCKETTDTVFDDSTEKTVSVVVEELPPSSCKGFKDIVSIGPTEERVSIVVQKVHFDDGKPMTDDQFTPLMDISEVIESVLNTKLKDSECDADATNERDNPVAAVYPAAADMRAIIQRLHMQLPLAEESNEESSSKPCHIVPLHEESNEESTSPSRLNLNKKRSPTKVRIKSPYENKTRILDEKKRKRLLEIRQKREKMKQAVKDNPNCKERQIARVNSITKLSITNKSFYDSIYGQSQNASTEGDQKSKKDLEELIDLKKYDKDIEEIPDELAITKPLKFTNRNYFLDDADTEMMYLDMNRKGDSQPDSEISSRGIRGALQEIVQLISAGDNASSSRSVGEYDDFAKDEIQSPKIASSDSAGQESGIKTPKGIKKTDNKAQCTEDDKKDHPSLEFRKSIDKIYDLINKRARFEGTESRCKSKFTALAERTPYTSVDDNSFHCTDSGTSLKHCLSSSSPSYFSFEKGNDKNVDLKVKIKSKYRNSNKVLTVVPKVIIGTKTQAQKADEKKKERSPPQGRTSPKHTAPNPLKAISQLLHEFDDVQKSRKNLTEKLIKKTDVTYAEGKGSNSKKSVSPERNMKVGAGAGGAGAATAGGGGGGARRGARPADSVPPAPPDAPARPVSRVIRKKVTDMFDEMREARGEAVRGPSFRLNARLNSLAQPKRTYVQAQIEDFRTRYGKSVITDRLQRLNASSEPLSKPISPRERNLHSPPKRRSPRSPVRASPSTSPVAERPKAVNILTRPTTFTVNLQKLTMSALSNSTTTNKKQSTTGTTASSSKSNTERISRIPILPNDIEIDSLTSSSKADDSSAIGNKIHQLVDIVVTRPFTQKTSSSTQYKTSSTSPGSTEVNDDQEKDAIEIKAGNYSCSMLSRSDVSVSAVSCDLPFRSQLQTVTEVESPKEFSEKEKDEESATDVDNSKLELEKIEKALYSRISTANSAGNVSKRLRRKNLTLTPKDTVSPLILLQSTGATTFDRNSISNFSENDASRKAINELGSLPWPLTQIPVQIATVGYVFPQYSKNVQHFSSELRIGRAKPDAIKCLKNTDVDKLPVPPYTIELFTKLLQVSSSVLHEEKEHVLENIEEEEDKNSEYYFEKTNNAQNIPVSPVHEEVKLTIAKIKDNSGIVPLLSVNDNTDQSNQANGQESTLANEKTSVLSNEQAFTPADEQIEQVTARVDEQVSTPAIDQVSALADKQVSHQQPTIEKNTDSINACKIDSLDVLVGLLNEIQKITSTQSQITFPGVEDIETVLKGGPSLDSLQKEVHNIISITSLEKLRQLESDGSMYSFCLSDNSSIDNDGCPEKVINSNFMDNHFISSAITAKEVEAGVQVKELVHKSTDVPSRLLPRMHNLGTHVTNSLIGVLSDPSSESTLDLNDIYLKRRSSFSCLRNVIRLPKTLQLTNQSPSSKKKFKEIAIGTSPVKLNPLQEPKQIVINVQNKKRDSSGKNKLITLNEIKSNTKLKLKDREIVPCNKKVMAPIKTETVVIKNNKLYTDLDPIINFKRDILVTVYSVLVFTVFAALSIPDILYRL